MRAIEDEGAQSLGGIGVGVIAQSIQQSHQDPLIDVQRRLSQSTVLAHPQTEVAQPRPAVRDGGRSYGKRKLSLVLEKLDEHRGGRQGMVIRSTAVQSAFFPLAWPPCRPRNLEAALAQ
jgi:hypothetical protein